MWQCGHVSVISPVSYSSACSFTALLPWLQDGRGCVQMLWWQLTGICTAKKVKFVEQQISCLANAKEAWKLWAMHFASQRTLQEPWLTAFKKCIALKLRRDTCLHHLNSLTYTDSSLCYLSAFAFIIALLSCFLVSLCSGQINYLMFLLPNDVEKILKIVKFRLSSQMVLLVMAASSVIPFQHLMFLF